jgi:hypothetical protein
VTGLGASGPQAVDDFVTAHPDLTRRAVQLVARDRVDTQLLSPWSLAALKATLAGSPGHFHAPPERRASLPPRPTSSRSTRA